VINGSWAVKSGLSPAKDAFILEGADSDFANVLVVRTADKDRREFRILLESFQSPEVKKFVQDKFKGSVVAAF
ncbi:MAG: MetQ/NlpA family ABC transporter substrate-binding protein, partial [Duodenibacillus sp.]